MDWAGPSIPVHPSGRTWEEGIPSSDIFPMDVCCFYGPVASWTHEKGGWTYMADSNLSLRLQIDEPGCHFQGFNTKSPFQSRQVEVAQITFGEGLDSLQKFKNCRNER